MSGESNCLNTEIQLSIHIFREISIKNENCQTEEKVKDVTQIAHTTANCNLPILVYFQFNK